MAGCVVVERLQRRGESPQLGSAVLVADAVVGLERRRLAAPDDAVLPREPGEEERAGIEPSQAVGSGVRRRTVRSSTSSRSAMSDQAVGATGVISQEDASREQHAERELQLSRPGERAVQGGAIVVVAHDVVPLQRERERGEREQRPPDLCATAMRIVEAYATTIIAV